MKSNVGNITANSIPTLRLSPNADETKPTAPGPAEQPKSPPSARSANIAVPPLLSIAAESEKVAGHIMPTLNPQTAQPTSESAGTGNSEIIRYDTMQSIQQRGSALFCGSLSPNFP